MQVELTFARRRQVAKALVTKDERIEELSERVRDLQEKLERARRDLPETQRAELETLRQKTKDQDLEVADRRSHRLSPQGLRRGQTRWGTFSIASPMTRIVSQPLASGFQHEAERASFRKKSIGAGLCKRIHASPPHRKVLRVLRVQRRAATVQGATPAGRAQETRRRGGGQSTSGTESRGGS